jgi:HAMP domain-containing protein/signal transduction histidine kinase/DNA-binding response OmpR family regulator
MRLESADSPARARTPLRHKAGRITDAVEGAEGFLDRRLLLGALTRLKKGDFSVRLPVGSSVDGHIAEAFNDVVELNQRMSLELERLSQLVGKEGRISESASLGDVEGSWAASVRSVNTLIADLVRPTVDTSRVIGAVAKGDLSQTMDLESERRPLRGEFLRTARTVNTMVHQLSSFASEVTRVAREVGTEGKLGGQAKVKGVAGTWKDLTENVNLMAGNLTGQVRNIAAVTTAVAKGDLTKKITVDVKGEFLELKATINTMVDQLRSFASEVTRVAREVGTEGKLGGQARVEGVSGTWKDLTDSVNSMAGNLTAQVRNIADVTKAVAKGDLGKKITVDVKGEILELKNTVNTMVDQLSSFAAEVTRVAREVGTEGKLGGQADVREVAGTWKDLTDSVNFMAGNLTSQVRNIADVTTAVANGDLSKKITVDVRGEILELKDTINTMVDQLRSFASEVTRVAREVGTEGKLGGQAEVRGVAGTWKDLTDNVNFMAGNLTSQVRNIADVTTAVAKGDLSKKITVDVKGEILELKNTINTMVDQLRSFASEVTRVAREVGTEGKLGGQADVRDVAGTWKDLTDSVNFMAGNLTSQVRNIADVTTAVAKGDLSKKITVDVKGEILELKDTVNTMVDQLSSFAAEVTRVAREVGTEGKLGGQADVRDVAGTWKDLTDNVNFMAGNLTSQVRNIADVTIAVAKGDLSKKITVDVKGEILELKATVNTMVDQLSSFAAEVTRVAREVGTEGKLGGQAKVPGVSGTWKDLTDNVNSMASNLTSQVRGIARVVTAVANGDLKRKLTQEAKGEIAALADTINGMSDTLATFAAQVTTVAREVGVEGKLGGQASVPGAAGTWKDLTDNVNQLAANLTTQVRAIAEVATAVTKGDLTRSIKVEASGEVAALKDNINEMIRNLKDTTLKNSEQDWLKTNLAKFSRMLQGQRDLLAVGRLILSELAPVVSAQQGVFYTLDASNEEPQLKLLASYACKAKSLSKYLKLGEALVGQCALEKQKIILSQVPPDYLAISSGLGQSAPANIIVLPVLFEGQVKGVLELASFERFNPAHQALLDQLTESIGIVLHTIESNTRTEDLLKQSQSLAGELQTQQEELRQTNQQLEEKAALLAERNVEVERKNQEVEQARLALEEKARQLTLTSKYKSEFLANMSHELRTPLNSLLILSDQLSRNPDGNLSVKQTEFAKTIHASGKDLLALINDILDLSKIESGTVVVDVGELRLNDLLDYVDRTFRHVAEAKKLEFSIETEWLTSRSIITDTKRIQQILKNLLSNAFKFTERGRVALRMETVSEGWSPELESLNRAGSVVAISVSDTGIGIPGDKQQIIFEAFQQADGSTSRKYGGTGLGLAISREIARLLGGEIRLTSLPGHGSTFTLYVPEVYAVPLSVRGAGSEPQSRIVSVMSDVDAMHLAAEPALESSEVPDDRAQIGLGDRVVLIVENDENFARFLVDLAHENGFKALVATKGADAMTMVQNQSRIDAITLDIQLPVMDGWRVLERLKGDLGTRHIPIYVITTEEDTARALPLGAIGALQKPIKTREALDQAFAEIRQALDRQDKELLIVCPDADQRARIVDALGNGDLRPRALEAFPEGLHALNEGAFDCVVLDLAGPSAQELSALSEVVDRCGARRIPVVLSCSEDRLSEADRQRLDRLCRSGAVKHVRSLDRLVDQALLYLHRPLTRLSKEQRERIERLYATDAVLAGKKVLIVDDDIRNIFAITSVLERQHMDVISAETGKEAIAKLQSTPGIDVVLMDVMMPDMDGYDTMQAIRKIGRFDNLPIIAVTAKAMKGDREKTLQAGAWDYLAKPVDTDQMLSVLRSWLYR